MRIFKFGGASVKDAEAVRNVANIIQSENDKQLLVVISAMGKTTNMLEDIVEAWYYGKDSLSNNYKKLKDYHLSILHELVEDEHNPIYNDIENLLFDLECLIEKQPNKDFDFDFYYDQIVSYGEFLSTKIVSNYLLTCKIKNKWVDARNFLLTNENHRNAKINWEQTERVIQSKLTPFLEKSIVISQGFIGKSLSNSTTTLGREGSDYSAAVFAYCTNAEDLTIWKDVDGVLSGDPKLFPDAKLIEELSYNQTIELAYYGASVIHPKTMQPLKAKGIKLNVRSFVNPNNKGTVVQELNQKEEPIQSIIVKKNQTLLHLSTKDFSFIIEEHLGEIFNCLANHKIKVNLMQNTAISFDLCIDTPKREETLKDLLSKLSPIFKTSTKENLKLYTYYGETKPTIPDCDKLLVQKHGNITHVVVSC